MLNTCIGDVAAKDNLGYQKLKHISHGLMMSAQNYKPREAG
jgi:hypothetical protein